MKKIIIFITYLALMLGARWFWSDTFGTDEQPKVVQGILDLRGHPMDNRHSILLDGDWEFYPDRLISDNRQADENNLDRRMIRVPGDWSPAWQDKSGSSFGYGTYRLRILVDEQPDERYKLWIKEIKASSVVIVNGDIAGEAGKPAASAKAYIPVIQSFTKNAAPNEQNVIDIFVQSANYHDPTSGGIIESMRFGTQAAIDYEWWYSIVFQMAVFTILLLHALYAGIMVMINPREKLLLVFVFLLIFAGLTVVSDHEYVLMSWFPLNYTWMLKVRLISYLGVPFCMLLMGRGFTGQVRRGPLFLGYLVVSAIYWIFILAAPANLVHITRTHHVFGLLYLIPSFWFFALIGKMVYQKRKDAFIILLAATSVISNIVWGFVNFDWNFTPIYYPVDIVAGVVGFSVYWFKRYFRNAAENARLNAELRKADERKDQFLANTSHELRTPLHGIINIAQSVLSREGRSMSEASHQNMELLVTISRRMSQLLNDLLDAVMLKDHRIVLRREALQVESVVSGVVSMLAHMTEGKPVQVVISIPDKLPRVDADEQRLTQIVFNLLHNAIKFTDEGVIEISAEAKEGTVVIRVADSGRGMEQGALERIFLPYGQAQNEDDPGGIGLGLSICKQLVELHGGRLTAESAPGQGAVFSFSLPTAEGWLQADLDNSVGGRTEPKLEDAILDSLQITEAAVSLETAYAGQAAGSLNESISGGIKILVVEDDPVNLRVLAGIFAEEPYEIHTALSAKEALQQLSSSTWDLLISDVMMPHTSGYELTRIVRERFNSFELPILLLTARSRPEDIYAGFMAGANDYVAKPVDALELKYRVRSLATLKISAKERLRLEAAYLQAQIQPHFLFNTINSIMALSDIDLDQMRELADAFTSYLRISIDFINSEEAVPLSHELELVRAYLYIEKARFGPRLAVIWDIDPQLSLFIPPLTVQPLVENAVKHGLLSRIQGGTVQIIIRREEGGTRFEVRDNGKGMSPEEVQNLLQPHSRSEPSSGGVGLKNTNRRLLQRYGRGLRIESHVGQGTAMSFVIPSQGPGGHREFVPPVSIE
ncbi:signal transduction histidine kinase [Paenibacillus rhizosphaerae]|uniref:histidine kinase n=1 Tax=Paenibacillus rhizosphaerae TaxID=297318 RepID=A0A839TWT1_9BACL|nr:ATP-binding protein [Paenibacillus rhizosphaerae]MBB3131132.1 signal transduction histidine kinase [Paenibacillus rhizosphaerae]